MLTSFSPKLLTTAVFGLLFTACIAGCSEKPSNPKTVVPERAIGIDLSAMDTSINPGDDFYGYANGNWMKKTKIPADRSGTGSFLVAFEATEAHNAELLKDLLETKHAAGTDAAKMADFYRAYLNTDAIDKAGMSVVQSEMDRYAAIQDKSQLAAVLGSNIRTDVDPLNMTRFSTENLFGVFVTQGLSTPGEVLPYLLQGGLGMPEREYYLSSKPKIAAIRAKYQSYIETLLNQAGIAESGVKAKQIFALESKIATAHATRAESEDFAQSASVWSRDEFDSKAPGIDWQAFFDSAHLGHQKRFAAYHAGAITKLSALVASQPLESWKNWLLFHQLNSHTDVLPTNLDNTHFAFYGTILSGTPQQRPRNKRAQSALDQYLSDAVGRAYAEKYFPASAKAQVTQMTRQLIKAFHKRVEAIDWMAPETKKEALAKVNSIIVGVGYPDSWQDYSQYSVTANNAYANVIKGEEANYRHQLAKLGKPMDKSEWWLAPQVVNALNLPVQNALNFPAGILQAPFFVANADPARNYGAIGAVIGHEISHSFDNNGAAFDASGTMRNWWTKDDFAQFAKQGDALSKQYDSYQPFPDLHVNGRLTLGENIADVAGLAAAYDAYRASLDGKPAPVIDGLTGDQRFFIGFAQTWASKSREAALRARIATNGHAPGQYRALTVRNIDAWYTAFDVKPGAKLYLSPKQRVKIW